MKRILYISPDFNYSCGVSKHVYINLKYLSQKHDYNLFFLTNGGDSLDRLNKFNNIKISLFKFKKDHQNVFYLIRDCIKLYNYCYRHNICIVHSHHRYAELISVIVSKFYNLKTITTVHSFVTGLNKISFRSDKIICVSKSVLKHINQFYPHTKYKAQVLYNCVDKELSSYSEEKETPRLKTDFKTFLFIGRNNPIKGFDILLNALKIVTIQHKLKLVVVGYEQEKGMEHLISNFDYIDFVGVQNDLIKYYEKCDIVVIPSRKDPFPYVMLEAATMRKPIIASNTGGIGEFISDGIDGTLFDVENAEQLAEKIEYLLNNYEVAIKMAEKLYLKVKTEYDYHKYFEVLLTYYKTLLSHIDE